MKSSAVLAMQYSGTYFLAEYSDCQNIASPILFLYLNAEPFMLL